MKPFIALIALVASLAFPAAVRAQTVDEIVARHIVARGGEKFATLKSFRQKGSLQLAPGMTATLIQEFKMPNMMRMDLVLPQMRAIRAFDGKNGWAFLPQEGDEVPRAMRDDELKDASEESDFRGPLLNYKEKGNKIELAGKEKLDDREHYKLIVTLKNGESRMHFIDAETFLESRVEGSSKDSSGNTTTFVQRLSEYKDVDGVKIPFQSIVEITDEKNPPQRFIFKVEIAERNPKFEDEHFMMPKAAPTTQSEK